MFNFSKKMVAIHILQNVPPSNLNRDDNGAPKEAQFGGVTRARLSSQSIKHVVRKKNQAVDAESVCVFTKVPAVAVAHRVAQKLGMSFEDVQDKVLCGMQFCKALGLKFDKKAGKFSNKAAAMLKLSNCEVRDFAAIIVEYWDRIDLEKELAAAVAAGKKGSGKAKSTEGELADGDDAQGEELTGYGKEINKKMLAAMVQANKNRDSDIALFGRMMASAPEANTDAACQVAHAISTNEVVREFDFFTAVDDIKCEDTIGSGMMGTTDFVSACFYRYANINIPMLCENLGYDNDRALDCMMTFIELFAVSLPSGKQNSFAAQTPPSFIGVVLQDTCDPRNMVNAFETPVEADLEAGLSISDKSVEAFIEHERDTSRKMRSRREKTLPQMYVVNLSRAEMSPDYKVFDSVFEMLEGVESDLKA